MHTKKSCTKMVLFQTEVSTRQPQDALLNASDSAWITQLKPFLRNEQKGSLAGLSFAVKDNIDVAGLPTTAACAPFAYTPNKHATVVSRLLQVGASLKGKTNLDQFACGLNGTRSPYGAVPNAFKSNYVSGGSSAGSAYVVAKQEVDFALGTDTAGSGRVPAGLNNIVGLKPSRGLVSAAGVVPAAQNVDCVSIFATTVSTAVKVLEALAGFDEVDPFSRALVLKDAPFPASFTFGIPNQLEFFGDAWAQAAFSRAIEHMKSLGGQPVWVNYSPLAEAASMLYGSALVAWRYAAICDFFDQHPEDVVEPVQSILKSGQSFSAADYCQAETKLMALKQTAQKMWSSIDVLLVPTAPTHYTISEMQANPIELNKNLGHYTNFVNLFDYAALSVPSEIRPDQLPFGITLVGPAGSDWQLADVGQRYHHSTGLMQGATHHPLPAPEPIAGLKTKATVQIAVVGAHLSGMPLNQQLTERKSRLIKTTQTSNCYQLFALPNSTPPKPGLLRVPTGGGVAVEIEIWEMPASEYGSFVALIPAPLGIGTLQLADGSSVQGFLCEPLALEGATNISHFGGWRAYVASLQSPSA